MTAQPIPVTALYIDERGLTTCANCAGMTLKAYVQAHPNNRHPRQFDDGRNNWFAVAGKSAEGITCETCGVGA